MSDDLTNYEYLRDELDLDEDYKDESILRRLYIGENMTQAEINNLFGLGGSGIQYWINKFDIKKDMSAYATDPPVSEEKLRAMYWDSGMSQSEIGSELGYNQATINNWMDKYNIETRGPEGNPQPPVPEEKLRELYIEKDMGCRSVAEKVGSSRNTISKWLDKLGIQKHNSGNRVRTEELVDEVVELYKKGMSQEQISDKVGVNQTTISNWLLNEGIDIRNKAGFGSIQHTKRGEEVKSTYEKTVADNLYKNEIEYVYEPSIPEVSYIPDFMVNNEIIEVWGIKNDDKYNSRREMKINSYKDNGYNVFSIFPDTIEEDTMEVVENV